MNVHNVNPQQSLFFPFLEDNLFLVRVNLVFSNLISSSQICGELCPNDKISITKFERLFMPTIKDIARLAGVSHGTVSNVLNQRGNVSAAKISAVKAAADRLGYQANAQAKTLRGGNSKSIALVVPDMRAERYHNLYSGMNSFFSKNGYRIEIFVTGDNEEVEKKQLALLASHQCHGVVVVSCFASADLYYKRLSIPSEKIIFAYRNPVGANLFFDINAQKEIKHLTATIRKKGYKNIGVFTEPEKYSNMLKFMQYLTDAFADEENIKIQHFSSPDCECHKIAFEFFQDIRLDAIICSDFDKIRHIRNACHLGSSQDCPPIYALSGDELHLEENLYCYPVNYENLGNKVAHHLINDQERNLDLQLKSHDDYRIFFPKIHSPSQPNKITFLSIPSPSTDALEKLLPHFFRTTGIKVEITRMPFDQLIEITNKLTASIEYDLIRIDIATLPWLAEKIFEPLKNLTQDLLYLLDSFPKEVTERYSKVNDIAYTLPFDPSAQMLFYRHDLFEDQRIRRIYFEKFRHEMNVPENFEQYDRLSLFFSDLRQQGEITSTGSCANTGGTEVIATEFLLRYYAKGGRLLHNKPPARLIPEIAEDVLYKYIQSLDHNLCINSNWWQDAITQFEHGNLSMLLIYNNLFSNVAHSNLSSSIGYSVVPGGKPLLGGGAIGIAKNSENKLQCALFMQWLFSPTITEQIVLLGGSSASYYQYNNVKITDYYPWLSLTEKSSASGIRENAFHDGTYFDLHHAEEIIGNGISQVIEKNINITDSIKKINIELEKCRKN
ncbi:extracellular solute-binding protein [Erwinia psidii]|nr:extracellular solute-binding protein [Erwinia psidii]